MEWLTEWTPGFIWRVVGLYCSERVKHPEHVDLVLLQAIHNVGQLLALTHWLDLGDMLEPWLPRFSIHQEVVGDGGASVSLAGAPGQADAGLAELDHREGMSGRS